MVQTFLLTRNSCKKFPRAANHEPFRGTLHKYAILLYILVKANQFGMICLFGTGSTYVSLSLPLDFQQREQVVEGMDEQTINLIWPHMVFAI